MMLLTAILLAVSVVGIAWLQPPPARLRIGDVAGGTALGFTAWLWLPYLASSAIGLTRGTWLMAGLALAAAAAILARGAPRAPRTTRGDNPPWGAALAALLTAMVAVLLFQSGYREGPTGVFSGGGGCEDMGMHSTLAHAFLHSDAQVRQPAYPIFSGWPLGYPFLADFSATVGMTLGTAATFAFFVPAAFALLVLVGNAWVLAREWFEPTLAALTLALFLLGGNLGFWFFLSDLPSIGLATALKNDYVANFGLNLHYGNMVTSVLVPMRTSLFGVPLAFAVAALLCRRAPLTTRESLAAGIMWGALPLVNAHAFIGTTLLVVGRLLPAPLERAWAARWMLLIAVALGTPQVFWISRQTLASATPFIRPADGFLFASSIGWLRYWLLNAGLFVPLGIVAWFRAERHLQAMMLPWLLLLPISMFVSFQPNPYDNVKLLVFTHLACALLVTDGWRRWRAVGARGGTIMGVAGLLVCTASGALAWVREIQVPCQMATPVDRAFAALVLARTEPSSIVLTAQHYTHPVPFLAGRTVVLGFHNWLGQHGIPFGERATDVAAIYAGTPEAVALLAKYGVTDAIVGPLERQQFGVINEQTFERLARDHATLGPYTWYGLRRSIAPGAAR